VRWCFSHSSVHALSLAYHITIQFHTLSHTSIPNLFTSITLPFPLSNVSLCLQRTFTIRTNGNLHGNITVCHFQGDSVSYYSPFTPFSYSPPPIPPLHPPPSLDALIKVANDKESSLYPLRHNRFQFHAVMVVIVVNPLLCSRQLMQRERVS